MPSPFHSQSLTLSLPFSLSLFLFLSLLHISQFNYLAIPTSSHPFYSFLLSLSHSVCFSPPSLSLSLSDRKEHLLSISVVHFIDVTFCLFRWDTLLSFLRIKYFHLSKKNREREKLFWSGATDIKWTTLKFPCFKSNNPILTLPNLTVRGTNGNNADFASSQDLKTPYQPPE